MKRHLFPTLLVALLALAGPVTAQNVVLDDIDKKAAQLESDLGKQLDTTPRAADIMIELVNLYHQNGRVFGLVRAGQKFITAQPTHKAHRDVMLKLLDGQTVLSRNKEIIATARQFLQRYPTDAACSQVEKLLARTLDQQNDRKIAAAAHEAVYRRNPAAEREAGAVAIYLHTNLNNTEGIKAAAAIGRHMLENLPAGEFTAQAGWDAVHLLRRVGDWGGANVVAQAMLKRGVPMDKSRLADLHAIIAENYIQAGQRANAIDHLKLARAAADSADLFARQIYWSYESNAKGGELEAMANDFATRFPARAERWQNLSLAAHAYARENNRAKAVELFTQVVPQDAWAHDAASHYVRYLNDKPEDYARGEKFLREAAGKSEKGAPAILYALAFELYRDRMKDAAKATAAARELATKHPMDDSRSWSAAAHMLSNPESPQQFIADVKALSEQAVAHGNLSSYRDHVPRWIKDAAKTKEHKENARIAKEIWDKYAANPVLKDWEAATSDRGQISLAARERLVAGDALKQRTDGQARWLLMSLGQHYYYNMPQQRKAEAIPFFARLSARLPQDVEAAGWWLTTASDYGSPEQAREAALHMIKLELARNNAEAYRRVLLSADRAKDPALFKAGLAWINASQQKLGLEAGYAAEIGVLIEKAVQKDAAMQYWRDRVALNPSDYQSRAAVGYLAERLPDDAARAKLYAEAYQWKSSYYGFYASQLASLALKAGNLHEFERVMRDARKRFDDQRLTWWGMEEYPAWYWISEQRDPNNANFKKATDESRRVVYSVIRDLKFGRLSAFAELALIEMEKPGSRPEMARLLDIQRTTAQVGDSSTDWDTLLPFAQAAMTRKDYLASATLTTGMLANIGGVEQTRLKAGRDMVGQSYGRLGSVGLAIDEKSPIAPLLQAALYLRLGDEKLALDTYTANRKLFDDHRNELPVDLILFVCESHIASGGDENHDRVEDILRSWLVKFGDSTNHDDSTKAKVQVLLGKNYFGAKRYEVARAEFQSLLNRFSKTPEAVDAEFGIGETFMAQKLFDEADKIFEKLANSRDRDTVIRAEFLRGILASRRGDRDAAREIFRSVLERSPNINLANLTLFNLSEVYGAEQRYIEQLELLNTVGRLGRASKRWHTPGSTLSIVVQDSDLGISRGHSRIPVRVTTEPGGDEETIYLQSGGAGKGLFRADLQTQLGSPAKGDRVLQITGRDVIKCDYPEQFKAEFKNVPLADAEIRIAADARFEASSHKIVDEEKETFSTKLAREEKEEENQDKRVSQNRPKNQIKPGNVVYLRVQDSDRDMSDQPDNVLVKLTATSGDQVQAQLQETGPHTGVFEGTIKTGELPAGALATDHAIDHNPLMAIDQDKATFWQSEPDGQTPKWLSVDMKDLKRVSQVVISTPDAAKQSPVRGEVQGSHDGRFWFRVAANPAPVMATPVKLESARMTMRTYAHKGAASYEKWADVVQSVAQRTVVEEKPVDELSWQRDDNVDAAKQAFIVIWHGKFVQPRDGAVRFQIAGTSSALVIDGVLEQEVGKGGRSVDVWLARGTHDMTAFALVAPGLKGAEVTRVRENLSASQVTLAPFRKSDFDLDSADAKITAAKLAPAKVVVAETGAWTCTFEPQELRYVRFLVHEYRGEAVAINHIEVRGDSGDANAKPFIPTEADVLKLAGNDALEIAAGDTVTASYTDEFTFSIVGSAEDAARNRVLTSTLQATYFNGRITPIAYDLARSGGGGVQTQRKELMRIDPGERVIVEVVDYDRDETAQRDTVKIQVAVNDGKPIELTAIETDENSGVFTKEVDTQAIGAAAETATGAAATGAANPATKPASDKSEGEKKEGEEKKPADPKLSIKPGDRVIVRYIDQQNTFPGHSVPRESYVLVSEPTPGKIRIVETRLIKPPQKDAKPQVVYLPPAASAAGEKTVAGVAFEVPLTVEVIDPDRAKDSRSTVMVELTTTDGAKVKVNCAISSAFSGDKSPAVAEEGARDPALEEGRFVGQVIMQLGGKSSPSLVPLTVDMPKGLIGAVVLTEEAEKPAPKEGEKPAGETEKTDAVTGDEQPIPQGVTRVLNLTGKDIATAKYKDERRPVVPGAAPVPAAPGAPAAPATPAPAGADATAESAKELTAQARLISNGNLAVVDRDYDKPVEMLHVGEKLFVRVVDADLDVSDDRDKVRIQVTTGRGEDESVELEETLAHSGVFTGSLQLKAAEKATPGNLIVANPEIEAFFGDTLKVAYLDKNASTPDGTLALAIEIPIVVGTDGLVKAFSKVFGDETLAVETRFTIAESYFELFKSHKKLARDEEMKSDLESGKRILREVMEDYPDPKYVPRIQYLFGQFAQELQQWDEAIAAYGTIVRQYPEHALAPDAQYKLAQSYEERGDFDQALEAYVTLAATYPKSPLIANVMIRINEYFWNKQNFIVAASVGEKFLERFQAHQHAAKMAFRIGQCYYKAEQYTKAAAAFDEFVKNFPEDELTSLGLFWSGESFRMANNVPLAFRRYNRCRWDFPESEAAKYARGRLALPEMLAQFEREADLENDK